MFSFVFILFIINNYHHICINQRKAETNFKTAAAATVVAAARAATPITQLFSMLSIHLYTHSNNNHDENDYNDNSNDDVDADDKILYGKRK